MAEQHNRAGQQLRSAYRRKPSRRAVIIGLATAGIAGGGITWWTLSPHPLYIYRGHSNSSVDAVAWSPDGKRIASGSEDHTVQVWEPQ